MVQRFAFCSETRRRSTGAAGMCTLLSPIIMASADFYVVKRLAFYFENGPSRLARSSSTYKLSPTRALSGPYARFMTGMVDVHQPAGPDERRPREAPSPDARQAESSPPPTGGLPSFDTSSGVGEASVVGVKLEEATF